MKVERMTYAKFVIMQQHEYERIHGLVTAYGGRVLDVQVNWDNEDMIMFYEMGKNQRVEFEKELYSAECFDANCECHQEGSHLK